MTDDDGLSALLRDGLEPPAGKPPRDPAPQRHSRLPELIVLMAIVLLILTPLVLMLSGDPAEIILGMITGDPTAVFGGLF